MFKSKNKSLALNSDLPALPENLDDNFYLASASRAGEIDRNSGAYDEFLFSEDGLDKMPFESSVDHHLALAEIRLLDRGRRSLLARQEEVFDLKGQIASAQFNEQSTQRQIEENNARLDEQTEILNGEKTGVMNLYWKSSVPVTTSTFNAALRIMMPVLTFIIVGLVDIAIIIISFTAIPEFGLVNSILFSLPAVGVQLVFPHFIGSRLNLISHGYPHKKMAVATIIILLIVWLTFVAVLTEVRMNHIITSAIYNGEELTQSTRLALYAANAIMLIGLGTWLIGLGAMSNHHKHEYIRLSFKARLLDKQLIKQQRRTVHLQAKLPALQDSVQMIQDSYSDAVSASRNELAEAAKSVYRRSLVNQFGSVEFTGSFLGLGSSATEERLANKRKLASIAQREIKTSPQTDENTDA